MLYVIIKKLISGFLVNQIIIAFLLIYALSNFNSCAINKTMIADDEDLKTRINQFYTYFKDGRYDKCWSFLTEEDRGDKKEYIEYAKKFKIKIVNHKIDKISIEGFNAKIKMIITAIENNIESTNESIDCWVFKNGNWYMKTAGRVVDWECK